MYSTEILKLEGKYYGTRIQIKKGNIVHNICVWNSEEAIPSIREFEKAGITKEQWLNNEIILTNEGGVPAMELLEIDRHVETEASYQLALDIKDGLDNVVEYRTTLESALTFLKVKAYSTVDRLIKKHFRQF